ncbi:MAG: glutathione S-transferase family protein [Acetobacteraceae bacterium]|nr:glutathione S-transferase family protein [Acetobacteraceae bacterium]
MDRLVSHHLCPYVQRVAIVAAEKGIALERRLVDLAAKPDWFLAVSPTGKVPLLQVTDAAGREHVLFESAAIAESLDETGPGPSLMPADPIARARTRAWVEFASATLSDIAGLYAAPDQAMFDAKREALAARFRQAERACAGPWFAGAGFGLVDAAFGPVFRYLDAFETLAGLSLADGLPKVAAWRAALAARPSVAGAVAPDYPERLRAFLLARGSVLSRRIAASPAAA